MTPEELYAEIDTLARERCCYEYGLPFDEGSQDEGRESYQGRILAAIRRFGDRWAAEERERCAKVCETRMCGDHLPAECAAAIRVGSGE